MASQNLSTIRRQEMPSFFLPLAPATSSSTSTPAADVVPRPPVRRSSSLGSEGSTRSFRILKLAPVRLGEHADEHKEDWHDIAVE